MLELKYKKTKNGWGLSAGAAGQNFYFSGTFEPERIRQERMFGVAEKALTASLWTLLLLGLFSLALELYPYSSLDYKILLTPNLFNLVFWVGIFCLLYILARRQQKMLTEKAVNLLQLAAGKNQDTDIYELFSTEAKYAWNKSSDVAATQRYSRVQAVHIFSALLQTASVRAAFTRLGTDVRAAETFVTNYSLLHPDMKEDGVVQKLPFVALQESMNLHNKSIDPLMLLCALLQTLPQGHIVQNIFYNIGVTLEDLEILATWVFTVRLLADEVSLFKKLARYKPEGEVNRGLTSVPTPFLDHFSSDLTTKAKHGRLPLALGRGGDLSQLLALAAEGNGCLVIKGAKGTGRTTVVNELAYKMATEQVPPNLQDKRLVRLELSAIVGSRGNSEQALENCLREAASTGNIVLVLEDIHELAKASSSQGLSLLDLVVDFLSQHDMQVLATTTLEDYTSLLQTAGNFEEIFASYELLPLSKSQILLASCIRASILEMHYGCYFSYKAVVESYNLSNAFVKGVGQPEKTISILVEAAALAKNAKNKFIDERTIQNIVSRKTHIPASSFSDTEAQKLLKLEHEIEKYVVGQKQAVVAVAESLRRARSGLSSAQRPFASFMFLGPTGVGKTELAKTLANVYFGKEEYLLRLDMSEYAGPEGISKLAGSASNQADSVLVTHLKNYPFCLLLCDEFEKASPEVQNLFLQILEDGRLTTAKGQTLDLTQTMVIATSNAGTREIQAGFAAAVPADEIRARLLNSVLPNIFRPELLNRFDGLILFTPLRQEEIEQVTYLQLQTLRQQLYDKGIRVEFGKKLVRDISKNAFNPLLGARPIRRYIQDHLEGFMAKLILSKQLQRGSEVVVDIKNGKLVLE